MDEIQDKWRNYQHRLRLCGARCPEIEVISDKFYQRWSITSSWQTGPRVWTSSKAQLLVVPRVATQQKGIIPWDLSSKMAASSISPDTERSLSGSNSLISKIFQTFTENIYPTSSWLLPKVQLAQHWSEPAWSRNTPVLVRCCPHQLQPPFVPLLSWLWLIRLQQVLLHLLCPIDRSVRYMLHLL